MQTYTIKVNKSKITVDVADNDYTEIRCNGSLVVSTYGYWRELLGKIVGNIAVNSTLESK